MTKKCVISSFVLLLFLVSAMPVMAGMDINEVNLVGQFNGQWPDFNGFAWSVAGTADGLPPKATTVNDPNQLPSYATDYGTGTIRVFYTPLNGGSNTQTFSTDGNTDGFALTRIAIRVSGGGSDIPDENYPFTVHIFDVCDQYGAIPPNMGQIIPANSRPYSGEYDLLSGPAFAADPCFASVGSNDWDILLAFDFNEYDMVDLEPGHTYAFEVWGPVGWASAPPYIFGMVWNSLENTGPAGCGYQVAGSADNGNGPGAANLSNPRGQSLGGIDRDFVVGVYGDYADGNAYHPEPRKYQTQVDRAPMLTWHPGKWADVNTQDVSGGHQVWFSSAIGEVARRQAAANKGRVQDPCYNIALDPCFPDGLALNTTYYWRVDEYNDQNTVPVPQPNPADPNLFWGVKNSGLLNQDRPTIYHFTTISPSASSPVPTSFIIPQQAVFKPQSAWLSWNAGALVADTNGHQVYFGTNWNDVNSTDTSDTSGIYRGPVTDPCYPLKNLYPDYLLTSGTAYYWRVDEVNGVNKWTGPVWNFKMPNPATIMVEDFASSADFAAYWKSGYTLPVTAPYGTNIVSGTISSNGGILTLNYDNSTQGGLFGPWSEAMLDYGNPNGVDWTLGGVYVPKAISVIFDGNMGNTLNSTDANRDKLYMGIQDAQGNLGVVYYDSDVYAAQRAITSDSGNPAAREWKVALTDLTGPNNVDLNEVNRVFVGIGDPRGGYYSSGGYNGGKGILRFDNIKLYVQHCKPTYPMTSMVAGDLAGPLNGQITGDHSKYVPPDCVVNLSDIHFLMSDWLFAEPNLVYDSNVDPGTSNLTAWYKFDEGTGNAINDSSGHLRHGTLYNSGPFTWSYKGHDSTGYCVNLEPGYHTWIQCPSSVIAADSTGQSFTFWLKYNDSYQEEHTWSSVLVFHSTNPDTEDGQTMETQLPVPIQNGGAPPWLRWVDMRVSNETGLQHARPSLISSRWNHYALVYDISGHQMLMYVNGKLISGVASTTLTTAWGPTGTGDGNANSVRIGTRGNVAPNLLYDSQGGIYDANNWGFWQGRIDDMRLYSKALSENQVQYLATDGTGKRNMQAVFIEPDNYDTATITSPLIGGNQPIQIINFKDYNVLAGYWLNQQLWP
jgi:hypothetical protein